MRKLIAIAVMISISFAAQTAELSFGGMITDNMVLQQQTDVGIWGTSEPGAEITVSQTWSDTQVRTRADSEGKWEVTLETPQASFTSYTISASDNSGTVSVENVLIGEVWLCSGQSNMEMALEGFWGSPVEGSLDEIAMSAQYNGVRMITIPKNAASEPVSDIRGEWKECNPSTAGSFSAVGYFFATRLSKALGVPVGIINASWGGSVIEAWLNREYLEDCEDVNLADISDKSINDIYKPMIMYNGMFRPVCRYAVNGIVWYQGESNISIAREVYADRLTAMAALWRGDIGRGDIPFLIVQLAPYDYNDGQYGLQDENGPRLREQQQIAQTRIPNSALIGTADLAYEWEAPNVHLSQKRQIGERCCYAALNKGYGYTRLQAISPTFSSMEIEGNTVVLSFNDAPYGFIPYDKITGFELAGESGHFHAATTAYVSGNRVYVSANGVPQPKAVRYCFHDFQIGNLTSVSGLPVIPFRTDNWDY